MCAWYESLLTGAVHLFDKLGINSSLHRKAFRFVPASKVVYLLSGIYKNMSNLSDIFLYVPSVRIERTSIPSADTKILADT